MSDPEKELSDSMDALMRQHQCPEHGECWCEHSSADPRDQALAALKAEHRQLKDTNKRLNRRCQIAEAAANLKLEDWSKRGHDQGRTYIFNMGVDHGTRNAEAQIQQLRASQAAIQQQITRWRSEAEKAQVTQQTTYSHTASAYWNGMSNGYATCAGELSTLLQSLTPASPQESV